jgi:hypothetical protein
MFESRRHVLAIVAGAAGIFTARALVWAQPMQRTPQPLPSPHAPDPNFPPGLDGPDINREPEKKVIDPQKQRDIRMDIDKLYGLASDLKNQVDKTDLNSMLSIGIVKKAQEIEKLAKQIKQLSKG